MPIAPIAAEHAAALAAGKAAGKAQLKLSGPHVLVLAVLLGIAGALIFTGVRRSPGGFKVPARATEDVPPFTPPPSHPVLGTFDHLGPVVVSPHRYPAGCGGEISAVINGGYATLRLPHEKDIDWLTRPPSEDIL